LIEVIQKPSIRKADKPDVIMARMDYVIICRVIEQLNKMGMTDDELSFLLGKPNNYVFGFIFKPSDKNRFNEDQIDLLPYILNCNFTEIIPNLAIFSFIIQKLCIMLATRGSVISPTRIKVKAHASSGENKKRQRVARGGQTENCWRF